MNVWMIWLKAPGCEPHLEATWTGPTDSAGWREKVRRARTLARSYGWEIRFQLVEVPGARELFEPLRVVAQPRPIDWRMWGPASPLPIEAKPTGEEES